MGEALVKRLPIVSMESLLRGASNFVSGYMGDVLVNGFPILSIVSLLRGISKFIIGYMDDALVNGFPNLINGFFFKNGLKICK